MMYLGWRWLVVFAALNLIGGIAAAIANHGWSALICGVGLTASLSLAIDDYEKGAKR